MMLSGGRPTDFLQGLHEFEDTIADVGGDVGKSDAHSRTERVLIRLRADPGDHPFRREPFVPANAVLSPRVR